MKARKASKSESVGVRSGRRGGTAVAVAALAVVGVVVGTEGVKFLKQQEQATVNAQNLAAGKKINSYLAGTLVLHKGVHTYAAPDIQGRHSVDPGAVADGNEIPADDVKEDTSIANPVEYTDPDGTPWLGFTKDGTLLWVKMPVIGQTDKSGKPYAEWKGGTSPASIPTAVDHDTTGFYDVSHLGGPNKMPASLGIDVSGQ